MKTENAGLRLPHSSKGVPADGKRSRADAMDTGHSRGELGLTMVHSYSHQPTAPKLAQVKK